MFSRQDSPELTRISSADGPAFSSCCTWSPSPHESGANLGERLVGMLRWSMEDNNINAAVSRMNGGLYSPVLH